MKFKKIMSVLTAVTCCSCMFAYLPSFVQKTYASEIVHNDFEVTYEGWHGTDYDIEVTASDSIGYQNSRGMLVSGRKTAQDGAEASKGLYLVGDVDYNYSIRVFSRTDEKFHISLTCDDMDTQESTTTELVSQNVNANEWTELKASYKAPKNSCEFRITITTDTTNDFIFDELNITTKQTEKANAVFAATSEKGLKDEFADYFRVGNILNAGWGNGGTVANSAITANIIKDCNSIECENETKADSVLVKSQCSGTNIGVSLNAASTIIDFCIKNNIGFRGHAFVWHSQTPAWFLKENFNENGNWVSADVMNQRLESYMKNLFALYEKQYPTLDLYAYDICNECVSDDSNRTANNGGAREPGDNNTEGGKSAYVAVYGDNSFVEKAFTYARKYAPSTCKLYYNDYNEYWDHKRDCIYNMCKSLYEKGVLDGVGMQSHIPANATGFAGTDSYIEAMKKYLSIGCDVQITELDISLENGKYTAQEQADKYKAIFQAAMNWNKNPQSSGKVTLIAIWGPNDANSWLKEGSDALLYDKNNQPKLAYTTLTSMIPESEWGDGSNYSDSDDKPVEPNEWGWYFSDGFEGDTCSWEARGGDVTIMTSGRTAFVGNKALLVQGRTSSWNGASKSLNPKAFVPGNEYSFSANVNYFDGDETDKFYLKLQYTDSEGETQYSTIAEATAIKGEWVQIANKNYKIPADASDMQIYIETAETTNNFYIDEVIGAVGGTTIIGAEPSTKPSDSAKAFAGDANLDGIVDIADAVAVASYVGDSKLNALESQGLINADVQGDGNGVNANDALMIQQYLAGIISELTIPGGSSGDEPVKINPSEYMVSVRNNISEYVPNGYTDEQSSVEYGTLKKYQYYSTTRERQTNVNVLLPPGYNENETYPVLYAMHGYWETEDSLVKMSQARNILGNLIAKGEAKKMIVVFPYIYTSKYQESCSGLDLANSLNYDNFINDLTNDLMPYIESNFSVKKGRENTAITGFSMGGRESLFIGLTRSDLFGYVGASCPAPGLTPGADLSMHPGQLQENQLKPAYDNPYLIMITGGGNDGTVGSQPSAYHNILTTNNVDHVWHYVTTGGHDFSSVQPHFYNYLRAIFKAN